LYQKKKKKEGNEWWVQQLTLVIPAPWEPEIKKIMAQVQPRQKVNNTPFQQTSQAW
jgi:hypothetical protein